MRRAALPHLAPFAAQSDVAAALAGVAVADPDPDARRIAATTIGAARSVTAVDRLAASTSDAPQNTAGAFFALTESWPAADRQIPPALRTAVRRLRWQAHRKTLRNAAGRGFVGGMIALGGLGLAQFTTNPTLFSELGAEYRYQLKSVNAIAAIIRALGQFLGQVLALFIFMGTFGGIALATAALLRGLLKHVLAPVGRFTWVLAAGAAGVMMGGAFVLLADVLSGDTTPGGWAVFVTGFAVGLVTSTAGLVPLPLSKRMRTAVVLTTSVGLFTIVNIVGLSIPFTNTLSVLLAGLVNGIGFLIGLPLPETNTPIQSESR